MTLRNHCFSIGKSDCLDDQKLRGDSLISYYFPLLNILGWLETLKIVIMKWNHSRETQIIPCRSWGDKWWIRRATRSCSLPCYSPDLELFSELNSNSSVSYFFCYLFACLFVCLLRQGFSVALEPVLDLILVDQAGHKLTEICLPLPFECRIMACATTIQLFSAINLTFQQPEV